MLNFFDDAVEEGPVTTDSYAWQAPNSQRQGYYFGWFGMGSKGQNEITGVEQPYEFAVSLDGEPADGGLDWQPTYEDGPEPSDEPIKFDSANNDDSKKDSDSEDGAGAADDESDKPSWLLPVVIGSGLLLLLLIGLLVFLLRRKNKGATSRVNVDDEFHHDPRNGSTAQFGPHGQGGQQGQAGPYGQSGNPYGGSPNA